LPGAQDFEALIPPVGVAWVRQVAGVRLWVYFRFNDHEIEALALMDTEPVRVD
jgi:hypothetical protein